MTDPCRPCGACCASLRVLFPRSDGPEVPRRLTEASGIPDHLRMRRGPGGCLAFEGEVGVHTGCTIYAVRPEPCRAFAPSTTEAPNPHCDAARARFGLLPLVAP